ncbi:MAG: hypothetical protein AB1752_09755 [Candidatus Zixiibacteriota bacterium]
MKLTLGRVGVVLGTVGILLLCADRTAAGALDPEVSFGVSLLSADDSHFHHEFGWSASVGLPIHLWRSIDLAPQLEVRRHLMDISGTNGGALSGYTASANIRFRLGRYQFVQAGIGSAQFYLEEYTRETSGTRKADRFPGDLVTTFGVGVNVKPTTWGDFFVVASVTRGPAIWLNQDTFAYALRTGFRMD